MSPSVTSADSRRGWSQHEKSGKMTLRRLGYEGQTLASPRREITPGPEAPPARRLVWVPPPDSAACGPQSACRPCFRTARRPECERRSGGGKRSTSKPNLCHGGLGGQTCATEDSGGKRSTSKPNAKAKFVGQGLNASSQRTCTSAKMPKQNSASSSSGDMAGANDPSCEAAVACRNLAGRGRDWCRASAAGERRGRGTDGAAQQAARVVRWPGPPPARLLGEMGPPAEVPTAAAAAARMGEFPRTLSEERALRAMQDTKQKLSLVSASKHKPASSCRARWGADRCPGADAQPAGGPHRRRGAVGRLRAGRWERPPGEMGLKVRGKHRRTEKKKQLNSNGACVGRPAVHPHEGRDGATDGIFGPCAPSDENSPHPQSDDSGVGSGECARLPRRAAA